VDANVTSGESGGGASAGAAAAGAGGVSATGQPPPAGMGPRAWGVVALAVLAVGISDIMTQLVLMRELLCVFAGNELVFGVILGNWLVLMGAGAYLGRFSGRLRHPLRMLAAVQILVALLPIASVYALRVLRNVVYVRGMPLGLTEAAAAGIVVLGPYCLVAGFVLTLGSRLLSPGRGAGGIAHVYLLDSIGGIIGGAGFSFVLVYVLGHFGILYVPGAINLLLAGAVAVAARRWIVLGLTAAAGAVLAIVAVGVDLETISIEALHPGGKIVYHGNSPYGRVVVTKTGRQYNFIISGLPLFSTDNALEAEETVHYAMAQRPAAKNVLLVAGGVSGTTAQILKYPVERLDYVELDPLIIEVARRYVPGGLDDPRMHVATTDGRLFVKQALRRYDVVILDVPDPSTLQINRFYTVEFFREVRRVLAPGGVLCFSLGRFASSVGPETAMKISTAHRTLKQVFDNVLILPPGRVFFLASDGKLTADEARKIAERIDEAGVVTEWMHAGYLDPVLTLHRFVAAEGALREQAGINRDFKPTLYTHQLLHWMREFPVRVRALQAAMVLLVVLAIYLVRLRAVPLALLTTGFAASALEVVILVAMQILHGMVYHMVGVIVTLFMAGLVVGVLVANRLLRRWGRNDLVKIEFAIAGFALLLPLALTGLGQLGGRWGTVLSAQVALPALAFVLAVLAGMEFPLAARADFQGAATTAARLFLADMVGACLGAMLVSTLLIPLMSVAGVCYLTAAINAATGVVLLATRRQST